MNERIKELIKQCTSWSEGSTWTSHEEFDKEKFAELIVKECADIALKKGMASPDTDFRTGSYVINQYLLTHFGVEE